MSFDTPDYFWIGLAAAVICTSWIVSELTSLKMLLTKLEKRGMDIEYELHVMQQSIDSIGGSVDEVEKNTRP